MAESLMHRKNMLPWLLIGGAVLLMIAASAYVELRQRQAAKVTPTPAAVSQVQRVTLEQAKRAYDSGQAIFVDVRDGSSYSAAYIPGALLIPISELTNRLGELDPNEWIITYCT